MIKIDKNEMRVEFFHLDYRDGGLPAFTAYVRCMLWIVARVPLPPPCCSACTNTKV